LTNISDEIQEEKKRAALKLLPEEPDLRRKALLDMEDIPNVQGLSHL
jgi:hypothetical protein